MLLATLFLTGCALCTAITGCFCWIGYRHVREAALHERRLQGLRADVAELAGLVTAHDAKLRTINGRLGAMKRWGAPQPEDLPLHRVPDGDPCPNWRTQAFPEGDDCGYCQAMRAERAAARAALPVLGSRRQV